MAPRKKGKVPAKKYWKRIREKGLFLFRKGKRFFSILALPLQSIKERYRRWPRFLQVCSLYLLVLLFAGAIFVWRSAQLRTINPYIENIKFSEPEDDYPLEESGKKQGPRGDKNSEGDETEETATAGAVSGISTPEEEPGSDAVWPVQGKVLFPFRSFREDTHIDGKGRTYHSRKRIEIEARPGDEVRSILSGRVSRIINTDKPSYGKEIIIEHEGGYKVYYGALEESRVKEGEQVSRRQVIATVKKNPEGKTYLYLRVEKNGKTVDPESILP